MDRKLDHFVTDVGGCGLFQAFLSTFVYGAKGVGAWAQMFMAFGGYDPGWSCNDGIKQWGNSTETTASLQNSTASMFMTSNNTATTGDRCDLARYCQRPLTFTPGTSTVITEWSLVCDRDWIPPTIISIQMAGVFLGSFLCGPLGERFGRKTSLYTWLALGTIANTAAGFSTSWEMLAAFRFLVGVSAGGNLGISQMFVLEFVTGVWRARLSALPTWNFCSLILGVIFLLFKNWRYVHFATAIFSLLILLTVFWVPESLRWLAIHGKTEQARRVALKICTYNRRPRPNEADVDFSTCEGTRQDKKATLFSLFRRSLLRKTILTCLLLFIVTPMYYVIGFGVKALYGDFYINFLIYSALPIPTSPLAPVLGNTLGRRWGSVIFMAVAVVLALTVVVVELTVTNAVKGITITVIALILSCLVDLSFCLAVTFLSELFPTSVRATGFAFAFTWGRVGSIIAPYLIPRRAELLYVSYIALSVMGCMCCAAILGLPETNKRGLEDCMETEIPEVNGNSKKASEEEGEASTALT